ncbi:MAG: hypothetical protein ACOYIK_08525, partial [Coriobacteriales bacterium]
MNQEKLQITQSVCPECLRPLPAWLEEDSEGNVLLCRTCPDHGEFRELVWEDYCDHRRWGESGQNEAETGENPKPEG